MSVMIVSIMHQDQNQSNEQSVQRKQKILPDPVNFISHSNAGMDQSSEKGSRRSSVTGSGRSEQIRSLRDIVRQESQSRQETDELYQRLQHEYDSLLAKYAQAENTIDQLRIGAKINLFSDGPTLNQAREIVYVDHTAKSPQRLSFPKRDQAMISDFQSNSALDDRIRIRSTSDTAHDGCSASPDRDTVRTPEASIESVKLGVLLKLRDLQDDIAAFQSALAERELNYVEQRDLYSALKSQHEQLKAQLQNASNGDKKTTDGATSTDTGIRSREEFVNPNSLEGELKHNSNCFKNDNQNVNKKIGNSKFNIQEELSRESEGKLGVFNIQEVLSCKDREAQKSSVSRDLVKLYRVGLRLEEISDEIGEQLSKRVKDKELEKALQKDFSRLKRGSVGQEEVDPLLQQRPVETSSAESSERSGNGHHQGNDISRFMSSTKGSNLGSDHGMDDHRSYHSRGGKRLPDQKDKLEPETDELAESGYYTISPRKDSFLRDCYLTKSQSIDMTSLDGLPVRRRWSSSQSDSQEESWIEERSSERSGSESDLNVSVNDDVRGHREWRDHSNSFTSSLTGKTLTMRRPSSQNTVNDSEDGSNIQYSNRSRSRSGSGSRRPSGSATRHRSGSDTRNRLGSDSRHRTGDKRQNLCRNPKSTSSPHEDEMYNTNFLTEAVVPDSKRRQYVSPDLSDASPPTFELRDSSYPKSQSHRSASVSSKRSSLPAERQGEKIAVNSVQSSPQRHRSSKSRKQLNSASGMKESSDESVNLTKLNRRKSSDGRNSLQDTNLSPGYQERFTSKSKIKDRERSHKGSRLRPQDLEDNGDEVKLRPLTSESNGDSGFHGSEGTMQSQEQLAHNYMQQVPRVERHWSETISPMRSSGTRFRSSRRSNRHDLGQYENVSIPETASSTVLRDFPRQSKPGLLLDPRSGGNKVRRHREIPVDISPTSTASPEHSQEYYLPHSIVSDTSFDSYRPRSSGEKYRNQMISLREKMSSKRSHSKSRIKDDVEHTPITSRLKASRRRSASLSTLEEMPSTSSRGRSIRAPRSDLYRDSETQTKMQGSKSPESEKSQRSERSSRATDLVRGELQRLRSHLAEEARLKDIHSAITDDLRRRQAELDRDLAKRGLQESQREMYNELKHQIEDLAKKIQGHSKTSESPPNDHQKLYEEVKRKLDTLAKEVRESRKRDAKQDSSRDQGHRTKPSKAKEPPREYHTPEPIYVSSPSTTVIPVCPVCDGVGYHKHGNYVFPRDFLSSKQHVRFVPAPTSLVSPPSAPTLDAASTPIHQVQAAPTDIPVIHSPAVAGYATSTPVHHHLHDANHRSTQPPLYRVIPDRVRSPTVALYPLNATIHHIHTYHRRGKADISSSDESDEDIPRTLSKSQRHRPSRPRFYSSTRTIDELDDWRLNQSLDDASRAARDMQRISKRMLNTIATDLINSSYAEL